MAVMMAIEERICARQSGAREWWGFWRRQWRGMRVAWKRKYLGVVVVSSIALGELF
jgi:hypothetical protein